MPPVSSSRNIAVVRMVFCRLTHSTSMVRRRMNSAMASAPNAPTAPASVGVAAPEKIDPITSTVRTITGVTAHSAIHFSRRVGSSRTGGAHSGLNQTQTRMVTDISMASRMPGTMPAMNRWPIEVSVTTP